MNPIQVYKRRRKTRNRRLVQREMDQGRVRLDSLPHDIYFNPENRCNLHCIMCRNTAERRNGRPTGPWDRSPAPALRRLKKLGKALPCWDIVRFTGSGETLLCPDLFPMIALAKRHGVTVAFATNGQLIDRVMARRLVRSGIDDLVISVDAALAETYERIRVGASWEKLQEGISEINRAKDQMGSSTPRLILSGNFARYNIEELPGFIDLAARSGASGVYVFKTLFFDPSLKNEDLSHCPELTLAAYEESRHRAVRAGVEYSNFLVRPREAASAIAEELSLQEPVPSHAGELAYQRSFLERCDRPWTGLLVNHDGLVRFCCAESNILGNLDDQSFDEIWNGGTATALRRLFLEGRLPEGCRRCPEMTRSNDLRSTDAARGVSEYDGYLLSPLEGDTVNGEIEISGWIVDPPRLADVWFCVDGQPCVRATIGIERSDVARLHQRCGEDQKPGLVCRLNTRDLSNGYHLLHILATGEKGQTREMLHRSIRVAN